MMDSQLVPIIQGSRDLRPSSSTKKEDDASFTFAAMSRQRDGISRWGIPGRIWEAAYILTRYLASSNVDTTDPRLDTRGRPKGDARVIECYDPPWAPGSTLSSTNVDTNYSHSRTDKAVDASSKRVEADPTSRHVEPTASTILLIELGAGMGYVGLAAAESLLRFVERGEDGDEQADEALKGVAAARHNATVILTDLPDVCVLLKENVALQMEQWKSDEVHGIKFDTAEHGDNNGLGSGSGGGGGDGQGEDNPGHVAGNVTIQVRDLAWGHMEHIRTLSTELCKRYLVETPNDDENGPQLTILCSDLVYFPTLLAPLLRSLIELTSPDFLPGASPQATILIAYRVRSIERETPFWRAFGAWFHFEPILTRSGTAAENNPNGPMVDIDGDAEEWQRVGWDEPGLSFLFIAHRRLETLDWVCPQDDKELLYGGQVDDTFEILLMLCSASGALDE